MTATDQQIAGWRKVYDALTAETQTKIDEYGLGYWVTDESDFQSICVGWCMGQGMTLTEALDFYDQMIPLQLF